MYIVRYELNQISQLGFMNPEKSKLFPMNSLSKFAHFDNHSTIIELIPMLSEEDIIEMNDTFTKNDTSFLTLDQVKLLTPIEYGLRNLFCLGKNYLDHINEVKSMANVHAEIPKHPIYFTKNCHPAIGPEDFIIVNPTITQSVDYEVELAVIIKKQGKNIPIDQAQDYIFGYTIANDISARDIQMERVQWHKGKSLDTFSSLGPYILHASGIKAPVDLEIKCLVNDEIRQHSRTSNMIFDINYTIADLSKGTTLYPGDIILTGTPAGVGMGFNPPRLLQEGDKVTCEIENIGSLTNYVKHEK
ncbi:MAG: fumarylacetoacetate hydrolase family protein [Tissierellales bacterium]|nr:fumarylacetoacetate hydrolase family protein [Tissierellales bacterium]MBN2827538.1 fumarylacetoacetate hydrolase family protein [Tissierellales bacterium]